MLRDILDKYGNATAIHAIHAVPDALNDHRIARIARVQVASPILATDEVISNWWIIHFVDLDPVQVAMWPPCNHAGALASYPKAIAAEPIPSPHTQAVNIDTPQALLDLIRAGGYSVSVNGENLAVSQAQWIDAELAALITSHKIGLIKVLESEK